MSLFGKRYVGGFMDQIRCDEPSYLVWKWHPSDDGWLWAFVKHGKTFV